MEVDKVISPQRGQEYHLGISPNHSRCILEAKFPIKILNQVHPRD